MVGLLYYTLSYASYLYVYRQHNRLYLTEKNIKLGGGWINQKWTQEVKWCIRGEEYNENALYACIQFSKN